VSGDGVLTEFQDFRCLFPSWIYQFWALRAGSQLGGLRAQKHAELLEPGQGWKSQFSVETALIMSKIMDFGARKSKYESQCFCYHLCDHGQMTSPLRAPFSSSAK
jgi:hypothetical protein